MMRFNLSCLVLGFAVVGPSVGRGAVTVFENNGSGWTSAAESAAAGTGTVLAPNTINFDDVTLAAGADVAITGDRYATLPGGPTLAMAASPSSTVGQPLFIYRPSAQDISNGVVVAHSAPNLLTLDDNFDTTLAANGAFTVTFSRPVAGIGAYFIGVDGTSIGSTGIGVEGVSAAFSQSPKNGAADFLGVTSTVPFTAVTFDLGAGLRPGFEGVFLDDLAYSVVLIPGDANNDGKVDLTDLNIVLNHLGATDGLRGDGNFDAAATIDLTDLNEVLNNLGTGTPAAAVAAPEPAWVGAWVAGGWGLLMLRRRRGVGG